MSQTETHPAFSLSSYPQPKQGVMAQHVLEEMVLYDEKTEIGYSLNASARSIWDLCDGARSIRDICNALASDLQVEPELLHDDVLEAVNNLAQLGLLLSLDINSEN